jgi:hypothetical protein
MWFSVEALGWTMKDPHLNQPLLTATPAGAAAPSVLFNDDSFEYHYFLGFRGDVGFWLDSARNLFAEGGGFVLEKKGTTSSFGPNAGLNVITLTPAGAVTPVAVNTAEFQAASRLWGADGNVGYVGCCCGCDIAFLAGYAYRDLLESIDINIGTAATATTDQIETRNQFSGGQVGVRFGGVGCSGLFVGGQAMFAFGNNHETAILAGSSTGAGAVAPGGLFVGPTNAGRLTQNHFTYIPQGDVRVGYLVNRYLMIYAGYTYLYWRNTVRPGDLIPTVGGPPPAFHQTEFWAQGANVGFELRY